MRFHGTRPRVAVAVMNGAPDGSPFSDFDQYHKHGNSCSDFFCLQVRLRFRRGGGLRLKYRNGSLWHFAVLPGPMKPRAHERKSVRHVSPGSGAVRLLLSPWLFRVPLILLRCHAMKKATNSKTHSPALKKRPGWPVSNGGSSGEPAGVRRSSSARRMCLIRSREAINNTLPNSLIGGSGGPCDKCAANSRSDSLVPLAYSC
jgi:hypothetical protein